MEVKKSYFKIIFMAVKIDDTYNWFTSAERVTIGRKVDVDDVAEGIGGILSNTKLALLRLSVIVEPFMGLGESSK